MGLDMYAYVAAKAGEYDEYGNQDGKWDAEAQEWVTKGPVSKPREIAYWRKHPNLHGWMEKLAEQKNLKYESFNGIEMELTWQDLDALEHAVKNNQLPGTSGFFFGNPADEHYRESDLEFVRNARAEVFLGLKVFYNSSW
jgi:hypothetical protein